MKRGIILVITLFLVLSPRSVEAGKGIGVWWMDPIKMWVEGQNFTLWFRASDNLHFGHFCLSIEVSWSSIGNSSGFRFTTISGITHYWVQITDTSEITFTGKLSKAGEIQLLTVSSAPFDCGKEGVNIKILPAD